MSEPAPWVCLQCQQPQSNSRESPPFEPLCSGCRERRNFSKGSLRRALAKAGVPARFRQGRGRDQWQTHFRRAWPEPIVSWAGNPCVVHLWGPTGTGKTSLASILLSEHLDAGGTGMWVRAPRAVEVLRSALFTHSQAGGAFFQRGLEAQRLMDSLCLTPLLVLDDLFAGNITPFAKDRMLCIIAERYDALLPTVITTLLNPSRLLKVEASISSRLASGLEIGLMGDDRRAEGGGN